MFRSNEPLGLPAGSVRALMTLGLLATVCVLCLRHETVPDILQQGFLLSLGMYHLGRTKEGKALLLPYEDESPEPAK